MSISISGNGVITGATTSYSFDQSVSIGGTLTYEDVTNIDSVGVITARSGIDVGPTSTTVINANGSATFASSALEIASTGNLSINRTSATNDILNGKLNGSVTSTINADGLVALGDASNSTGNNGLYLGGQNGSLNIYTDRYSTDCFQILNTSGSGTNVALKVYGKGDVEIAGIIQSNIQSAGNIELDSTAAFTSPTIKLFASNGSAEFSGYLRNDRFTTKAGLSLNLSGTDYAFAAYQDSANPLATIGVDGTATFAGNITLSTAGTGIDFSATAGGTGTDTSELFDDYEEGTFTPGLSFGGGTTGITYGEANGTYTKVGRFVFCTMVMSLTNKGSSSGDVLITGLPYATQNTPSARGGGGFNYTDAFANLNHIPVLYSVNNSTEVYVYQLNSSAGAGTRSDDLTSTNFTNATTFRAYFSYYTNT